MKILFCTPAPLDKRLGAAKVIMELAEEMRNLGCHCDTVCPADLRVTMTEFPVALRRYLHVHAQEYDVVDYDHEYLPYARSEFPAAPLFVARSVLLVHHLETIPIPHRPGYRAQLGRLLRERTRLGQRQERICRAQKTIEAADLVNVSNDDDKRELVRRGVDPEKIVVVPYGISRSRRPLFDQVSAALPDHPTVAFVGTFDYRKGAREFPEIVQRISQAFPEVRFKMLGVKGFFKTEQEILAQFPVRLRRFINVILNFGPEELPQLLTDCSVGVFPSYIEGMPFGVLEMLAASVPVIAYDSPGPPMMLPSDYLVSRGDASALANKVTTLLTNREVLIQSREWAKEQSQAFSWEKSAKLTEMSYAKYLIPLL